MVVGTKIPCSIMGNIIIFTVEKIENNRAVLINNNQKIFLPVYSVLKSSQAI